MKNILLASILDTTPVDVGLSTFGKINGAIKGAIKTTNKFEQISESLSS